MSKFSLYTDKHNQFRWRFTTSSDKVVARSSEGYGRKEECLESLQLLQKEITGASVDAEVHSLTPQTSQKSSGEKSLAPSPVVAGDSRPVVSAAPVSPSPAPQAVPAVRTSK